MSQASLRLSWYVLIIASIIFNYPSDGFLFTYFNCSMLTNSLYFSIFSKSLFYSLSNNSWLGSASFLYICSTSGVFELLLSLIVSVTFILFSFPEVSSVCIFVSTFDFSVFLLVKLAVCKNYSRVYIYAACCLKYSSVKWLSSACSLFSHFFHSCHITILRTSLDVPNICPDVHWFQSPVNQEFISPVNNGKLTMETPEQCLTSAESY